MTAKSNLLNGAAGTLTATNGGGPDNFDAVTGATATTLFLDTTLPFLDGGNALQVAAATPNPSYASWTGLGASTLNGRVALAISALPTSNLPFIRFANPANGGTSRVVVNPSGKLVLQHGANQTGQTSATVLAPNTWYQVDVQVIGSTTNASTVVRLYSGDGSQLLETINDSGISGLASATVDRVDIGFAGSNPSSTTPMWLARAAISDAGWIGPYVASSPGTGYEPHTWGLNYNGDIASGSDKRDGYLTLKSRWGVTAFGRLREYGDLNDLLPSNILTEHNLGTVIYWSARLRRSGSGMLPYTSISQYKADINALADQVCGLTFGSGKAPYIVIIFQHEPDAKTAQKSGTDAQYITAHRFYWDTFKARCIANGKPASFVGPNGKVRRGWCPTGYGFTAGSAAGGGIAVTTLHPGDDYVDASCADPYRMEDNSNTDGTDGVTYNAAKRNASKDIVWICKQVVSWLKNNGHTQPLTFTELNFHEDLSIPASGGTAPSWNHAGLPAHTGVTTYKAGKWDDYNIWRKTEPMVVGSIPFNASLVNGREDFHIDQSRWPNTHNKLQALMTATTYQAPVAKFTLTPTSGDTTTLFTVDASASTDPAAGTITRVVEWGDGATSPSAGKATTATHTYTRGGSFVVKVTVTSSVSGLQGVATQTVAITAPTVLPPDSVTSSVATVNNSTTATLTINEPADTQRTGIRIYKDVDPNDDLPSVPYASLGGGTQGVTSVSWTDPATYRPDEQHFYVIVNVGADGVTLSTQASIVVTAPDPAGSGPIAVLAVSATLVELPADGSGVTINADGGGSSSPSGFDLSYTFSVDDGWTIGPSAASSASHLITQPGNYVFRLVVDDGHGGTDEDTQTVTVSAFGGNVTPNIGLDRYLNGEPFAPFTDQAAQAFWDKRQRSQDKVDAVFGGFVDPTDPAEAGNPSTNIMAQKAGMLGLVLRASGADDESYVLAIEDPAGNVLGGIGQHGGFHPGILSDKAGPSISPFLYKLYTGADATITWLGDSVLEGTTVTVGGGTLGVDDCISLVTSSLTATWPGTVTSHNRAHSGRTTAWELNQEWANALADNADLYVFCLGKNDLAASSLSLPGSLSGQTTASSAAMLESKIAELRQVKPNAAIAIMTENPYSAASTTLNGFLEQWNAAAARVAAAYDVEFVDGYRAFTSLGSWDALLSDGVHPNGAPGGSLDAISGHALLARAVMAHLPSTWVPSAAPAGGFLPVQAGRARVNTPWRFSRAGLVDLNALAATAYAPKLAKVGFATGSGPWTSTTAGDTMTATFNGGEAFLDLKLGSGQGIVDILVDGTPVYTGYDLSNANLANGKLLQVMGPSGPGWHYVLLKVISGSVTFNGIIFPRGRGQFLARDTGSVVNTGMGATGDGGVSASTPSGVGYITSAAAGTQTVTFVGTGLGIHCWRSGAQAIGYFTSATVDGVALTSPQPMNSAADYQYTRHVLTSGLTYGKHIVVITYNSGGLLITGFDVFDESPQLRPGRLEGWAGAAEVVHFGQVFPQTPIVRAKDPGSGMTFSSVTTSGFTNGGTAGWWVADAVDDSAANLLLF